MFKYGKKKFQAVRQGAADLIDGATGKVVGVVGGTALTAASANSYAAGPDFTTLTTGVDFSTVGPALLLIAVSISSVYVIWKGAKMILSAVKSA